MSRRDRSPRWGDAGPRGTAPSTPSPGSSRPGDAAAPSPLERLAQASVPALALLPLRLFFGATFVYAGLDKLLDPSFFDPSSPASIAGQLAAFARVSPLAPLVRLSEPFAVPIGLLIAAAEIAIGLGALTGLAFRLAAVGGFLLSILFWLTASWTTQPYYYGADLPYAMGWLVLALAGDGGLLVPRFVRELGQPEADDWPGMAREAERRPGVPAYAVEDVSPERRLVLQAGVLGVATLALASLAAPLRLLRRPAAEDGQAGRLAGGAGSDGGPATLPVQPSGSTSGGTGAGPAVTDAPGTPSLAIASITDVDRMGARRFRVPVSAPRSLPAGDPGVIVRLADGTYVAYDATCTHEGCRVGWDAQDGVLLCPCHGAAFDPSDHGAVLGGPTSTPLLELPIVVDQQAGTISLRA